jgi:hypothetical protein
MVEHVYYILTGRKVLRPPEDLDNPLYEARWRAYSEQRKEIESIARAWFASIQQINQTSELLNTSKEQP